LAVDDLILDDEQVLQSGQETKTENFFGFTGVDIEEPVEAKPK
jgi:hypothetical protein